MEVASVTPFSARALDRGLAGALVALARHAEPVLTPARAAWNGLATCAPPSSRGLLDALVRRVEQQAFADEDERAERMSSVHSRVVDLLDSWRKVLDDHQQAGAEMQYQRHELRQPRPLLREMLEETFESAA